MKKNLKYFLLIALAIPLCGCSTTHTEEHFVYYVQNGGFETSDLSGWTIEYGDAYTDDSVSSREKFYLTKDEKRQLIDIDKTGNWFLSGQGFDLSYHHGRVGALRSNNFLLDDSGIISLKLAGGSATKGRNEDAPLKNEQEICYVGVYLASNDQMIARQTNEYFVENSEETVDVSKYESGVYHTDNFSEYTIDLSKYANQECYLRIVDNDKDVYYGYLSVDDIRVGYVDAQEEGAYYVKSHNYLEDIAAKDEYHIKNPDFETGSLAGWTIVDGDAFSHEGVNSNAMWWNESITYNRDGNYHYGYYNPKGTGILRSSVFTLGGAGYVSFKLGGCERQDLTYIRFMLLVDGNPVEIARVSNVLYKDWQFPFVPMQMHLLNMLQYYIDLSEFIGGDMFIEIVDNNAENEDKGCMTFDSFETYYESTPYWQNQNYYKIDFISPYEREVSSEYQVYNGTFETGDLSGWNKVGNFGEISDKSYWWDNPSLTFNKRGIYFFSGETLEVGTGTLTSSAFTVGGSGYMTFRMSGGRNPLTCYISIIDASTNEELLRFTNFMFNDLNIDRLGHGSHLMDMVLYKADLTSLMGRKVKIQVHDHEVNNWGLVCVDSFITYYESVDQIKADAILNPNTLAFKESASEYQVLNGTFETGDMSGWTASNPSEPIMRISRDYTWWYECFLYNRGGSFLLTGLDSLDGSEKYEKNTGTLTSSSFTLSGSGFITLKLGGGKNKDLCYIEFLDASDDSVLTSVYNQKFRQLTKTYYNFGEPIDLAKEGYYSANMVDYKVDLSAYLGKQIKIRIVDNATNDWGLLCVDEFKTYYEDASSIPANYELMEQF